MKTLFERNMETLRERLLAEQRERDMEALTKRPKCEHCGDWLIGSRAHVPPGARICATCEGKKR